MKNNKKLIEEAVSKKQFPRLLYKYRDISDTTKKVIADGKFWFAQPKTFNDPFDCNLSETKKHSVKDLRIYLIAQGVSQYVINHQIKVAKKDPEQLRRLAVDARNKVLNDRGVLSLSSVHDNILMWSHYAANHSGLVICMDLLKDPNFFDTPLKVKYENSYSPLNYFSNKLGAITKNISTKSKLWSYEEEIRIFKPKYGLHEIDKAAITKIYFGTKTTKKNITAIKNICASSGYSSVKFFQANTSYGKFKLTFSKV